MANIMAVIDAIVVLNNRVVWGWYMISLSILRR